MVPLLIKHPLESRTYVFDFGGGVTSPARGNVWAQDLLDEGETFSVGATLPLLLGLLLTTADEPSVTVVRSDGNTSDLEVSEEAVAGSQVSLRLNGGVSGQVYTLTVSMISNLGNVLVMQGRLLVTSSLP